MRRLVGRIVLGMALGTLAAAPLPARAEPDWIKAVREAPVPRVSSKTPAAVLFTRTDLVVDENLGLKRRERRLLRILQPSGLDLATFGFAIEPGGRLKRIKAWTLGRKGEEESKESDVFESTLTPDGYSDVTQVMVRAPRAEVGDLVAVEMTSEESLPFPSWTWFPQFRGLPLSRAELAVECPEGWNLSVRSTGPGTEEAPSRGPLRRELRLGPLEGFSADEPNSPPAGLVLPRVMLRFAARGADTFADWRAVATWYHGLSAARYRSGLAPADLIARGHAGEPRVRLATLAREVQHSVNYAAIELGRNRWEPDAAADTWTRRYGDCKDKAVLLAAVLEAEGIEARPVLTCTRDHAVVDPEWPDPAQFNHCIVAIAWPGGGPEAITVRGPSGKAWTIFDPTDTSTPLGLLPRSVAGAWAVIADPSEGLVQLPSMDPGRLQFVTRGRLGDDGSFAGSTRIKAQGPASAWLADLATMGDEQRRERAAALLSLPGLRPEIDSVHWLGTDSTRFSAELEASFRIEGVARRAGKVLLLQPMFPGVRRDPPALDTARTLPVWLGWPPVMEGRLEITLPAGMKATETPPAEWSGVVGDYRLTLESGVEALIIERRFAVREHLVPPERSAEVRALLAAAYRGDSSPIVLRPR